jgi:outer membrane lipoprotein LolB
VAARRLSRCAATLSLLLVLGACARPTLRGPDAALLASQAGREVALAATPDWSFSGRFAVSGQGEGGSGRIEWSQRGEQFRIELSAPVTRRSWRLSGNADGARLEGLEQGTLEGPHAEALLYEATGWSMPLQQLSAWVRGARARGRAEIEFSADGLPARLLQGGWQIEYRGWDAEARPALPKRVFAEAQQRRVRLVIDRWGPDGG